MNRKRIPYGIKLPVRFLKRNSTISAANVFLAPDFARRAVVEGKKLR